jgi:hypothetical protein
LVEIIGFSAALFRRAAAAKQFSRTTKPFFAFGAELRKRSMVITSATRTADSAGSDNRRKSMRTLSFILAVAFVLAGPSIAGSLESSLPGIGTFAYSGSPIVTSVPHSILVAAR